MPKVSRTRLLTLMTAAVAAPAFAQSDPIGSDQLQAIAVSPPVAVPVAPVQLAVNWPVEDAQALLDYVRKVGQEGLDPLDYQPQALASAISAAEPEAIDRAATATFLRLSSDLALGHVRGDARVDWHVEDLDLDGNEQYALMRRAVERHNVADALNSLLPTHPQYQELKTVLANSSDPATLDKIRTNLDRWRWLPRDLGRKYVIVNVPAYSVALVEEGRVTARRRAVAGAAKTATPQLNAVISGVIFNPWWEVPASISNEVRGKKGYVSVPNGEGGVRYRQPPGPGNALGKMKLVMPNPHAIYLHDTNAKGLFDNKMRAYSHGCIRTEDAIGFAATLLEEDGAWDRTRVNEALATGKTVKADLTAPVPVYITYFTAAAVAAKNEIISYKDIYGRDAPVVTALADRGGTALASAAK